MLRDVPSDSCHDPLHLGLHRGLLHERIRCKDVNAQHDDAADKHAIYLGRMLRDPVDVEGNGLGLRLRRSTSLRSTGFLVRCIFVLLGGSTGEEIFLERRWDQIKDQVTQRGV